MPLSLTITGTNESGNDEDTEVAIITPAGANDSSLDGTNGLGDTDSPNLTAKSSKFVQDLGDQTTKVYTMGSYTTLWIWNDENKTTDKDDSYKKVVLTEFDNAIVTNENTNFKGITYRVDGTKVTDLVVNIKSDSAYADAETTTIAGVLDAVTYKNNDTDTAQIVKAITIYGTDGKKVKYTADGSFADFDGVTPKKGAYVTLTQDKTSEEITKAEQTADWSMDTDAPTDQLITNHATGSFHNDKLILATGGKELTTVSGGVILKRYKKEGSWRYDVVDYTDVNVIDGDVDVWYNTTNVSKDGSKIQSDMIVVEVASTVTPPTPGPTTGLTVSIAAADGTPITATTTDLKIVPDDAAITVEPAGFDTVDSVQWYQAASATATYVKMAGQTDLTLPATQITDGKCYYAIVKDTEGNEYASEKVEAATRVATTGTFTVVGPAASTDFSTATKVGTVALKDQFGKAIAVATTDINGGNVVTAATGATTAATITGGFGFESSDSSVWFRSSADTTGVDSSWTADLTLTGDNNLKIHVTVASDDSTGHTVTGSVVAPTV